MVRVLFADDHAAVRDGIRRMLADDSRVEVVGDASDFSEAIKKAQNTRPAVLILDLHMPVGPGLSINNLRAELNSCGGKVLGISFANDDDARSLAVSIGAAELLDKMQMGKELMPAIMRLTSAGNGFPSAVSVKSSDRSALR